MRALAFQEINFGRGSKHAGFCFCVLILVGITDRKHFLKICSDFCQEPGSPEAEIMGASEA